jgi:hypothetical protein
VGILGERLPSGVGIDVAQTGHSGPGTHGAGPVAHYRRGSRRNSWGVVAVTVTVPIAAVDVNTDTLSWRRPLSMGCDNGPSTIRPVLVPLSLGSVAIDWPSRPFIQVVSRQARVAQQYLQRR